jgi:hypothetical protein
MAADRTGVEEPGDDARIWKYMDLARFVALTFSGKVWFSKLRQFWGNDPWEGFGRAKGLRRPRRGTHPASEAPGVLYAIASSYASKTVRNAADHVYASSWCRGSESLGMWERYASGATGVAIESTVGDFKRALNRHLRPDQYAFGLVKYHEDLGRAKEVRSDFTKGAVPLSGRLYQRTMAVGFHKRAFFADESERRAMDFQDKKRPEALGLDIPSDLAVLVSSVRFGPRADGPTRSAVEAVMRAAKLDKPVLESSILTRPKVRRSR